MRTTAFPSKLVAVAALLGFVGQASAQNFPVYRGRVLDGSTRQPIAGVIVEAQLRGEALPSGQRIVGRAKTDTSGRFMLRVQVNRKDIALIVSEKGSTSKQVNFGGQLSNVTDIENPLVIDLNPSTKKENVLATIKKGSRSK